ncbi:peptidoglycan-binding domain-containing protein [Kineococcus endophyticus]|uniref:Peptidoglycan-binding domain-containing protein n=1 Tax=Kineococcus endophyticus TaxID=1181883 RepID=A0ABV3P721_9ACTN
MSHTLRDGPGARRRTVVGALAAAPLALAAAPRAAAATLPTVSMEAVLLAAQWDPAKAGEGTTAGAGPAVRLVERALADRGLLAAGYVDGHFGTRTVAAYAAWQRSLGYSGLGATGLPGRASLERLGQGRFTVVRPVATGGRTTVQGFACNARTLAMLQAARRRAAVPVVVEQGSYSPGADPTSAGTHDGGGALDLDAEGLTPAQRRALVTALREVGFAAWLRTPAQGRWPLHVHAVAVSDPDLSRPAADQVGDYHEGRNGLANGAPDDGPAVRKRTWEQVQRG